MEIRAIVAEIVVYVRTGKAGLLLASVESQIGSRELRVACIHLLGWWANRYLTTSRHPYMPVPRGSSMSARLPAILEVTKELAELIEMREWTCHFKDAISDEEKSVINAYVREQYRPPLFTTVKANKE